MLFCHYNKHSTTVFTYSCIYRQWECVWFTLSLITVVTSELCELVNEVVGCEISLGLSYLFRLYI